MDEYEHYIYHGPVWNGFNKLVEERWYGETLAPTKEKAISNLKYRFRKEYDMMNYSKIYLDFSRLSKKNTHVKLKKDLKEIDESIEDDHEQLSLF